MKAQHSLLAWVLVVVLGGVTAKAQTFDSGSNGSDGALDLTGQTGTVLFNPASFNPPLDPDHDNVYHFTTIKIPSGLTVRLSAEILGVKPVVWLATGSIQISGTLDLNGQPGHGFGATALPSVAGAGGYSGGAGATGGTPAQLGQGPGGALGAEGGGGHAIAGGGGVGIGGAAYGNDFLIPLIGGSGGAGASGLSGAGGGGGAGGGALLLASSTSISVLGSISANGGASGCVVSAGNRGGGGGSGGAIRLIGQSVTVTGSMRASGTSSCNGSGTGSEGRIRIEGFQKNITGSVLPNLTVSTPGSVFPPLSAPVVRITSIGGFAVPVDPTASFVAPDVILDNAAAVTIQLSASKVPVGTIVRLTLTPETGTIQRVDSTPLAGTFESSTATATVTIPHGFSRFSVQANWTP